MKYFIRIVISALCVIVASLTTSCVTYYTVRTDVEKDGGMTKTIYAQADSACLAGDYSQHPFLFDPADEWNMEVMKRAETVRFIGDEIVQNFFARKGFIAGTQPNFIPAQEEYSALPYLHAKEKKEVKKGLFVTKYLYTCTFPGLEGGFPLSVDDYLDEQDRRILLSSGVMGEYQFMNGLELYSLQLSEAAEDYKRWIVDCGVEYVYMMVVDKTKKPLTPKQKEELYQAMWSGDELEFDLYESPDIFKVVSAMGKIAGTTAYMDVYSKYRDIWQEQMYAAEEKFTAPFTYAYRYIVDMPGKITASNAYLYEDGAPVWKVDGFRLLAGDVVLTAESRKINVWTLVILGVVLVGVIAGLWLLRRKKK